MSQSISQIKNSLFGCAKYVCGGHGARWETVDQRFTVPNGITINFYVPDGDSLGNLKGQQVDQILAGGAGPTPTEVITSGSLCWNYRLFSSKHGGYLRLSSSSDANKHYITETDDRVGRHLEDIVKWVIGGSPNAIIHWSACRAIEPANSVFSKDPVQSSYADTDPLHPRAAFYAALRKLASKDGKITNG